MRPIFPVGLLLCVTAQQACQRDEATAPQGIPFGPSARVVDAGRSNIAFSSNRDGNFEIYVMAADGSAPTRLTDSPGSDLEPTWSPDGQRIAFTSIRGGIFEIHIMGADGSAPTVVWSGGGDALEPSWSPDGGRIAFASNRTRNGFAINLMNVDGSGLTQLTNDHDDFPSWSPDGRAIAFASLRDGNHWEIFVMNADGSALRRLTSGPSSDVGPSWSPDGAEIAFSSDRDGNFEIYVMHADGSAPTRLTSSPGADVQPTWSPDGQLIAFTSERDGNQEIYVMNADGSAQTRVTNNPALDFNPVWSPAVNHSRAPAFVTFRTQPPEVVDANAGISPPVQVAVTDGSGTPVSGGQVKLELGSSPSGATLSGTTKVKVVEGVATFDDLRIDQPGRGYTLVARTGSMSDASGPFTVAGPAVRVVFVTQPPATVAAATGMAPGVRIAIQDALGTTVPGGTHVVTVALAANTTGATLSGTTTVEAVHGVATFNFLSIDRPGTYTLSAAAAGLTGATSSQIAVHLTFSRVNTGMHTCAITNRDKAYCWGFPQFGTLGDGGTAPHSTPVAVAGGLSFVGISTGARHSCGLAPGGAAYCWGHNIQGGLGDATTSDRTSPVPVSGGLTFRTVSAGEEFSCGVTTSGGAFCWGDNFAGELGTGTNTGPQGCEFGRPCSRVPVAVVGGLTFTTVSAGASHACGVTSDGAAYCWGDNSAGALGDGTTTSQTAPVLVAGGLHFKAVSAGAQSTCAVTTDNVAYCWGDNSLGQLGDGTTLSRSTPGPVAGGFSFVTISARFQAACGVLASGAAYCWGDNSHGQLGDGTTTQRTAPVAVAGGLTFAVVDAHGQNACGVTPGGQVYCWGDNFAGQLGNGTNTSSATPVQVVQ